MKKLLTVIVLLALLAGLLAGLGVLTYRHFVTNRITDIGGMENPEYSQSEN